jgi:hypothetical protein
MFRSDPDRLVGSRRGRYPTPLDVKQWQFSLRKVGTGGPGLVANRDHPDWRKTLARPAARVLMEGRSRAAAWAGAAAPAGRHSAT